MLEFNVISKLNDKEIYLSFNSKTFSLSFILKEGESIEKSALS